jgi:hypothetical protein
MVCHMIVRTDAAFFQVNRYVMITIFFVPLALIAFYEASFHAENAWTKNWLRGVVSIEDDSPLIRDPEVSVDECDGFEISKVPYEELIKAFPDTTQVSCLRIDELFERFVHRGDNSRVKQRS